MNAVNDGVTIEKRNPLKDCISQNKLQTSACACASTCARARETTISIMRTTQSGAKHRKCVEDVSLTPNITFKVYDNQVIGFHVANARLTAEERSIVQSLYDYLFIDSVLPY